MGNKKGLFSMVEDVLDVPDMDDIATLNDIRDYINGISSHLERNENNQFIIDTSGARLPVLAYTLFSNGMFGFVVVKERSGSMQGTKVPVFIIGPVQIVSGLYGIKSISITKKVFESYYSVDSVYPYETFRSLLHRIRNDSNINTEGPLRPLYHRIFYPYEGDKFRVTEFTYDIDVYPNNVELAIHGRLYSQSFRYSWSKIDKMLRILGDVKVFKGWISVNNEGRKTLTLALIDHVNNTLGVGIEEFSACLRNLYGAGELPGCTAEEIEDFIVYIQNIIMNQAPVIEDKFIRIPNIVHRENHKLNDYEIETHLLERGIYETIVYIFQFLREYISLLDFPNEEE